MCRRVISSAVSIPLFFQREKEKADAPGRGVAEQGRPAKKVGGWSALFSCRNKGPCESRVTLKGRRLLRTSEGSRGEAIWPEQKRSERETKRRCGHRTEQRGCLFVCPKKVLARFGFSSSSFSPVCLGAVADRQKTERRKASRPMTFFFLKEKKDARPMGLFGSFRGCSHSPRSAAGPPQGMSPLENCLVGLSEPWDRKRGKEKNWARDNTALNRRHPAIHTQYRRASLGFFSTLSPPRPHAPSSTHALYHDGHLVRAPLFARVFASRP